MGNEQFENMFIAITCIISSIPVTLILFKFLTSEASLYKEKKEHNEQDSKKKKNIIFISGAAAGFLCCYLLSMWCFRYSFSNDYHIPKNWLVGQWDVLNSSEPEKIAHWHISEKIDGALQVSGEVWGIQDISVPAKNQSLTKLGGFGPYQIEITSNGAFEFDYESKFGDGKAKFIQTFGLLGTYADDPEHTPKNEVDSGEILLHKKAINFESYWLKQIIYAGGLTVAYSWLSVSLSWFLFNYLKSHSFVKAGKWTLVGPIAFYYFFFGAISIAGSLKPFFPKLTELEIPGEWTIEYIENRDRYGYLNIDNENDKLLGLITLAKQGINERRARPRATSDTPVEVIFNSTKGFMQFNYKSKVGAGLAKLRSANVFIGRFVDKKSDNPQEENFGNLVAVKR